jgi:hypothetical protein
LSLGPTLTEESAPTTGPTGHQRTCRRKDTRERVAPISLRRARVSCPLASSPEPISQRQRLVSLRRHPSTAATAQARAEATKSAQRAGIVAERSLTRTSDASRPMTGLRSTASGLVSTRQPAEPIGHRRGVEAYGVQTEAGPAGCVGCVGRVGLVMDCRSV